MELLINEWPPSDHFRNLKMYCHNNIGEVECLIYELWGNLYQNKSINGQCEVVIRKRGKMPNLYKNRVLLIFIYIFLELNYFVHNLKRNALF